MSKTKAIILLITYDCNLKCTYCYEPKAAHHVMTFETAKAVLMDCINGLDDSYDSIIVQLMGGEPMLQFDLVRNISEWLWQQPLPVRLRNIHAPTNGTVLMPEIREWLIANRERFSLALSFDGNRLMHNINRSDSASAVDLAFFATTFPDVAVKMTLSPETLPYFYEGYRFLHDYGFNEIGPSLAVGDNVGWRASHLAELRCQLDLLVDYFICNPDVKRVGNFDLPVWNILNPEAPDHACRVGHDIACYDWNGRFYPCHIFSPIAMSHEESEASLSIDFDNERAKPSLCKKCVLNRVCSRCFGANFRDRGDCMKVSPFDCAQFKLFFLANCKYHILAAKRDGNSFQAKMAKDIIKLLSGK